MVKRSVTKTGKIQASARVSAKTKVVTFKVTPEQYAAIQARSEEREMRMGAWIRGIVLQAVMAPRKGRYLRIHEPDGATT